ncbi:long-chain fatty acid--CoA ligase [Corynebacterium atypicum]|uniref:Acyl-CoA synthetase n=1 Tax=Corynebacterium atypicum TaxID=191610 RepID=A0ABN4DDR6_9CORY|nr:long-chain fatty acid--CoA ligase [Corynebacterium atypicum]AIG64518.1 long-chain fatty acid--CoA ligase [Corynebacterium atypicum]
MAHTPAEFQVGPNETVLTAFIEQVRDRPYGISFVRPHNYEWVNVTSEEFLEEVFEVAKGLIANGVQQGDRIILLSSTRYEWSLFDFAIWAAGAVSVPIYPSSSAKQIQWIVEDSGAVFAVTETSEHTDFMRHLVLDKEGNPQLVGSPSQLRRIVEINSAGVDTLRFEGRALDDAAVWERIENTKSADIASIVYTSGTTGRPKGCVQTHFNWLSQVRGLLTNPIAANVVAPGKSVLTYLPLAHVLARAVSLACAVVGCLQAHWSDTSSLVVQLQRFRPNLLLGVPRVFEKVRNAAANQAAEGGSITRAIFARAERAAIEYSKAMDTPEGPNKAQEAEHKLFSKLVYGKLHAAVGGRVEYCITGGSPMGHELLHFFRGIGLTVYEGYGLTETCAAAAVDFEDQKIGSVGRPLGGGSVTTNENGELMFKGPWVFKEYWKNPEVTEEAFADGWYNTGDLGEVDEDGYVFITGRKKDLIVTAGGKNVSPAPLEDSLRSHPLISQALVVGDGKPFVGVLLTLDSDELTRWKLDHNVPEHRSVKEIAADPALRAEIQDAIAQANLLVSHAEAIKKFYILDRDLTEEENELTPTLKVKRNVVTERYSDAIDKLYRR